jgi:hypothetical protein
MHSSTVEGSSNRPGDYPLISMERRGFTSHKAAETYRQKLEAAIRAKLRPTDNPFVAWAPAGLPRPPAPALGELTSMPEPVFLDWLRDHGLTPPEPGRRRKEKEATGDRGWSRWWTGNAKKMTEYQIAKVWEALDRIHWYVIVETDAEEAL